MECARNCGILRRFCVVRCGPWVYDYAMTLFRIVRRAAWLTLVFYGLGHLAFSYVQGTL